VGAAAHIPAALHLCQEPLAVQAGEAEIMQVAFRMELVRVVKAIEVAMDLQCTQLILEVVVVVVALAGLASIIPCRIMLPEVQAALEYLMLSTELVITGQVVVDMAATDLLAHEEAMVVLAEAAAEVVLEVLADQAVPAAAQH
jgi:hypothetical protein